MLFRSALPIFLLPLPAYVFFLFFRQSAQIDTYRAGYAVTPCLTIEQGREYWAKPNCAGLSEVGESKAWVQFNDVGLRGKNYPPKAPPGISRILFFGSSNTLGVGIEEEETIPRRLEAELHQRGVRVEVINAAMVGYCSIQTSFRFRELVERYSPQIILYQFTHGTCPIFDGAWEDRVIKSPDGEPLRFDRTPLPIAPAALNSFIYQSPTLFFLWLTLADQVRKIKFTRKVVSASGSKEELEILSAPSLRVFSYMKEIALAHEAEFALTSFPMGISQQTVPRQMYQGLASIFARLFPKLGEIDSGMVADRYRAEGFPFLLVQFPSRRYQFPGDEHLNPEGAKIFSRKLALQLLDRKSTRLNSSH